MFLFPYRAQLKLHKWPVMTIAISLLCLVIYLAQAQSNSRVEAYTEAFCAQADDGKPAAGFTWWRGYKLSCAMAMWHTYYSPDPTAHAEWHVQDMERNGQGEAAQRYRTLFAAYLAHAPALLTANLWQERTAFNPWRMLTSSVAHGSWEHVIFNLIFFFAFAAAVELVLGPVLFMAVFVMLALAIGSFDQIISHWVEDPRPTLGLSGVVMGMMALFVYFLPRARIRFAFWFLLSAGTFAVPAWFVATWYVGWDLLYQVSYGRSYVNYVAHLAGAAFGLAIGLAVFRSKRHWAKELVQEKLDLTQDEKWYTTLNFITATSAILPVIFITGLVVLVLVIKFVNSFGLQLLLMSPVIAATWQIYRMKQPETPDWDRYQLGMAALHDHRYQEALQHLRPLAEQNYPRALCALGRLHAAGTGTYRDETKAVEYFRLAAERNHAEAQYALGTMYADGRGVEKNPATAAEWYEKAAVNGMPEAAMSLAHLHEHGREDTDKEQAIEWYHRAAVGYKKASRPEDAEAALRSMENLAARYPAVLGLVTRLRVSLALVKK
ncbi:MAG: rhomboid family intramembrane serine protease [Sulfuricaulis sp.]|uniref:rhomboid family intramembrane serine protease n=1 Tax=Sulfuricaulis sp. TaxID=2003553 RepID=UPI0025F2EE16|nr:rhomboid family intramembrane serine protease [Sulfuricaulis sp.]MCR4345976.1 rhomboid family intramembrane serine protease [Sulfuricaulis sp.]